MKSAYSGRSPVAQWLGSRSELQWLILVGVAYYLGAQIAFAIGTLSDKIFAPFWPPNIVLLAALISVPYRRWWLFVLATFPPHVGAELAVGMGWGQLIVAFATNCAFAVLSAIGLRYVLGGSLWLASFNNAIIYVLIAAVASPAASALGGAFVRVAGDGDLAEYWTYWKQWYLANALASLTLGGAFLCWADRRHTWPGFGTRARQMEALLLGAGLVLTCIVAFQAGTETPQSFLPAVLYLPLPLLIWSAVRFQTVGACAAILAVTITSIWLTLQGPTIFVRTDPENNVLALQTFLTAISIPILLLGASINDLRKAENTAATLARFVLRSQDNERRLVAKTLHDRIAQNLLSASWMADSGEPRCAGAPQLPEMVRRSIDDLRNLSYLLHPPLLDEGGLSAAVRALAMDYSQRTGIAIEVETPIDLGRLAPEIELTTFRVIEEALANVRHHSHSATARISIDREASLLQNQLRLTVEDAGAGMPNRGRRGSRIDGPGLGLACMRERLRCVGGRLEVTPSEVGGTLVRAYIPIPATASERSV